MSVRVKLSASQLENLGQFLEALSIATDESGWRLERAEVALADATGALVRAALNISYDIEDGTYHLDETVGS